MDAAATPRRDRRRARSARSFTGRGDGRARRGGDRRDTGVRVAARVEQRGIGGGGGEGGVGGGRGGWGVRFVGLSDRFFGASEFAVATPDDQLRVVADKPTNRS